MDKSEKLAPGALTEQVNGALRNVYAALLDMSAEYGEAARDHATESLRLQAIMDQTLNKTPVDTPFLFQKGVLLPVGPEVLAAQIVVGEGEARSRTIQGMYHWTRRQAQETILSQLHGRTVRVSATDLSPNGLPVTNMRETAYPTPPIMMAEGAVCGLDVAQGEVLVASQKLGRIILARLFPKGVVPEGEGQQLATLTIIK